MAPRHYLSNPSTPQARSIQISKSLSWLLRHGATKERIPITADGYVRLSDVLGWGKLRAMNAGLEEVVEVVQSNEKQRFGLRWDGDGDEAGEVEGRSEGEVGNGVDGDDGIVLSHSQHELDTPKPPPMPVPVPSSQTQAQTAHTVALAHLLFTPSPNPHFYSIRAVQGHSLKTIDAPSLLTRIAPDALPRTCVHGTFFKAWPDILRSGGLKAMGRNHVHFAGGPAVQEVLGRGDMGDRNGNGNGKETEEKTETEKEPFKLKHAMSRNAITSGMRSDAEVLIYVDVRRAMEAGMEWYFSENGVILTEGVCVDEQGMLLVQGEGKVPSELEETEMMLGDVKGVRETSVDGNGNANGKDDGHSEENGGKTGAVAATVTVTGKKTHTRRQSQQHRPSIPRNGNNAPQKLVPMAYWDVVVGTGVGVLWERGKGVVREVPGEMVGRGKRGGRGGGKGNGVDGRADLKNHNRNKSGGKPRMRVEWDDVEGFE
jgi:2'-phosphotransferase